MPGSTPMPHEAGAASQPAMWHGLAMPRVSTWHSRASPVLHRDLNFPLGLFCGLFSFLFSDFVRGNF